MRAGPYTFELPEIQEGQWLAAREVFVKATVRRSVIAIVAFVLSPLLLTSRSQVIQALGWLNLLVGVVFGVFVLLHRHLSDQWVRKQFNHPNNEKLRGEHSCELTDEGYVGQTRDFGESRLSWSALTGWRAGKKVTVLMIGHLSGITVPNRAWTDCTVDEVRQLLSQKLGAPDNQRRRTPVVSKA